MSVPCSHRRAAGRLWPVLAVLAVGPLTIVAGIYGGEDAAVAPETDRLAFPPHVWLQWMHRTVPGRVVSCSGVLYRRRAVLTAAHCLGSAVLGDPGDWDVKAYLHPRLNPRLVAGPAPSPEDLATFGRDQESGFGVVIAVDAGRALVHRGFEELPAGADVMANDLALIPLAAPANASADLAAAHFEVALTSEAAQEAGHRILGLGDVGGAPPRAGPQVCFRGAATRLPCRVQSKAVAVLTHPECVQRCTAWLDATTLGSMPRSQRGSQLLESTCRTMLEGVREGRLLCVHHPTGTAASGDSGGPLLSGGGVAGILSWTDVASDSRAAAQMPALYESTAFHREAIDAAMDCLLAPGGRPESCTFGPPLAAGGAAHTAAALLGSLIV